MALYTKKIDKIYQKKKSIDFKKPSIRLDR